MNSINLHLWNKICDNRTCPVDWISKTNVEDSALSALYHEWSWTYSKFSAAYDDLVVIHDYVEEIVTGSSIIDEAERHHEDELRNLLLVLEDRVPKARESFLAGIGRLGKLEFLAPSAHNNGKHAPRVSSRQSLIEASANGPSRFFSNVAGSELEALFWDWFANTLVPEKLETELAWPGSQTLSNSAYADPGTTRDPARTIIWNEMRTAHHLRISINCLTEIGASNGSPVDYVLIDLDLQTSIAHAFPIDRRKAVQVHRSADLGSSDILQGY